MGQISVQGQKPTGAAAGVLLPPSCWYDFAAKDKEMRTVKSQQQSGLVEKGTIMS
jgi:hypothetical protein